jgi:hypothetical protein
MLKLTRRLEVPSYPSNDPNMCPPYKRNYKGEIRKDSNGNNIREELEKWIPCPVPILKNK